MVDQKEYSVEDFAPAEPKLTLSLTVLAPDLIDSGAFAVDPVSVSPIFD